MPALFHHDVNGDIQLRLLEHSDAETVFSLVDRSRLYLQKWLPWVAATKTVDDSHLFIKTTRNQFASHNGFQAGIWYKEQLTGIIGFHELNWPNRSTSIGYWLGEAFQGQGIMTSSCRALVDIAFREYGLNRVEIQAAAGNRRSRSIPERLGFQNEGCRRQAEWLQDHFVDHVLYGMLAEDWSSGRAGHEKMRSSAGPHLPL